MTEVSDKPQLVEHGVYLITTTDHLSLVGEYAGMEGGEHVFVAGPFAPVRIPERNVAEAVRLA